jgi:VWFA-related protein
MATPVSIFRFAIVALVVAILPAAPLGTEQEPAPLSVRITSPLGRMGAATNIRFVAQIQTSPDTLLRPVRFYVDGVLLKTDDDGPPFAVEWLDENPFEQRELSVEVEDDAGRVARDAVVLPPFEFVEIAEVRSVLLEAAVYDGRGRFIRGLSASSFAVEEDGVPQAIDLVRQETLPATFALLIDRSQSMHRRIDFVKDAARRFLDFLRPADRVLVAPFAAGLGALTGPTSDRKTVLEAIEDIDAVGGTSILDSLVDVTRKLPADLGRRVVVLITDGYDEGSAISIDDALSTVKAAGMTVYVVGIGGVAGISLKGERLLKRIAAETGGQTFFPPREEEIIGVHERLAIDTQNRYLVTYTPTNQSRDGQWRRVSLTTLPDYTVRARDGYVAPKPPPIRPELEFTIRDTNRGYPDLAVDDLIVTEDGIEQTIDAFHEAVAPVSIVLALDASGSMRASAAQVVEAAREFVQALRPEDSLALILFADESVIVHDLTKSRETTLKAIDTYTAVGGTALYDALWLALSRLETVAGRRAVVVLSDGRDENNPGTAPGSVRTVDEVLAVIRKAGATIFPIGLGPRVDRPFLERLAALSGGESYFPDAVENLQGDYRRVVENLRRRYVLSYTSTNTDRNGAWREVRIRARSDDVVVTSQGGYFAPER